jgi:hypothetical protein
MKRLPRFVVPAALIALSSALPLVAHAQETDTPSSAVPKPNSDATADTAASGEKPREPGRTGHFTFGALGSVGFPRPLGVEGLFKVEQTVAVGLEYSALPTVSISGVETRFWALAADARIFPFRGPFFVGLKAGRQHLAGNASLTVADYGSYRESISVDTTFVNPRMGFLWTWEPGVTLGVDIGVQIPFSSTASNSLPTSVHLSQVDQASGELSSVAHSLGNTVLPTIDLLQIGVLL